MFIEIVFIVLLIGLDQLVKYLTVLNLKGQPSFIVIDNVFQFTYVENRGAAFGLLQNQRLFFLSFTIIIIAFVFFILYKLPKEKRFRPLRIVIVVFIAGTLGNFIDRFRLTYVIDTFYFSLIDFPVFNVADSYVVVSTILFAILILFHYKDEEFEFFKIRRTKNEKH